MTIPANQKKPVTNHEEKHGVYKHPFPSKKSFFQHKKFTSYIQSATHIIQTTSGQGEQAEVKSRYHCVQASGNLRICFGKNCRSCEAYQARILDVPLQKLLQSMSIAYRQNLTSPKWNRFKVPKSLQKPNFRYCLSYAHRKKEDILRYSSISL